MTEEPGSNLLDWLDRRNDWQFVAILYVVRWVVLLPLGWLVQRILTPAQISGGSISPGGMNPLSFFLVAVVIDPPFETVVECTLPYLAISWVRDYRRMRPKRPWGFVVISACAMTALHPFADLAESLKPEKRLPPSPNA